MHRHCWWRAAATSFFFRLLPDSVTLLALSHIPWQFLLKRFQVRRDHIEPFGPLRWPPIPHSGWICLVRWVCWPAGNTNSESANWHNCQHIRMRGKREHISPGRFNLRPLRDTRCTNLMIVLLGWYLHRMRRKGFYEDAWKSRHLLMIVHWRSNRRRSLKTESVCMRQNPLLCSRFQIDWLWSSSREIPPSRSLCASHAIRRKHHTKQDNL